MQCAKNHAAWYTDSSCSISVSNDFATQKKIPLGTLHFQGRFLNQVDGVSFFRRNHLHSCDAGTLGHDRFHLFLWLQFEDSFCNQNHVGAIVFRRHLADDKMHIAVTHVEANCLLQLAKGLHPEMLGKLRLHCHHLLILQHDDPVIPRARLNDLGFPIFCPHQHSDIAGKNCRGSQLDTEAREQQVLMRASDRKHHSCRPLILHSNYLLDHRTLCLRIPLAQRLLHTDTFTHRPFYTQTLLHTEAFKHRSFYTQSLSHTEAFTHRSFYTQRLLHTEAFTHRGFCTQRLLHTDAFTHRLLLHTDIFTHRPFYTQTLLHTDAFTRRCFCTQKLLHTDTFTHRHFYRQTFLHTDPFTHKHIYTQKLFHTEAFTHRLLYTQTLL